MVVFIVTVLIFFLNIPFGYWRAQVRKFSFQWFASIHIPIPAIILLRIYSGVGFALYTYPLFIGAFFLGQFTGKIVYRKCAQNTEEPIIMK